MFEVINYFLLGIFTTYEIILSKLRSLADSFLFALHYSTLFESGCSVVWWWSSLFLHFRWKLLKFTTRLFILILWTKGMGSRENSPFFMSVLQCRKKEQADCVHMISNKHVKGFNIVISSGKMVLSPVFHLVILTRWTNDHQTSVSSIWISSFFIVYTKWYCSPQLCHDWIILCVETPICLLYFLSTSTLCHHNKKITLYY